MVKGVPSERWDSFFYVAPAPSPAQEPPRAAVLHFLANRRDAGATNFKELTPRRPPLLAGPVIHRRKEDPYMSKEASSKKPISIRYTCAPNGDQVGLSYLMADAKKAK